MPIEARTFGEAVKKFNVHLSTVFAKTITATPLVHVRPSGSAQFSLGFRSNIISLPTAALIETCYGPMELSVGQFCDATQNPQGRYRVRTCEYQYTLAIPTESEPWIRWEYLRDQPDGTRWCRHHLQGTMRLPFGDGLSLNSFHLPTGYVTIEEVIRFCIHDLQVPPLSHNWDEVLSDSYQRFKNEFAV